MVDLTGFFDVRSEPPKPPRIKRKKKKKQSIKVDSVESVDKEGKTEASPEPILTKEARLLKKYETLISAQLEMVMNNQTTSAFDRDLNPDP